jgi:undecaprenyl-diphosphatase
MNADRMFSRRFLLIAAILTALLCPLLVLGGDREITRWASEIDSLRGVFFRMITQFGDALYPIVLSLLVLLLGKTSWGQGTHLLARWMSRTRQFFKFLLINVVVSGLLTDLLKILFGRSRPKLLFANADYGFHFLQFSAARWSFPSGHSTTAMAIALTLVLYYRRWGLLALVPAILTCLSRVALLQHYPSDVLAGAFVALLTTVVLQEKLFAHEPTL